MHEWTVAFTPPASCFATCLTNPSLLLVVSPPPSPRKKHITTHAYAHANTHTLACRVSSSSGTLMKASGWWAWRSALRRSRLEYTTRTPRENMRYLRERGGEGVCVCGWVVVGRGLIVGWGGVGS